MKIRFSKIFLILMFLLATSFGLAQISFQIVIGFGNVPTISLSDLPDYSVVIYTDEPFSAVYIDGTYAGTTDSFGRLVVRFTSEGYHTVWVVTSNKYVIYDRYYFHVEKTPRIVYVPSTRLGEVTVFSNVYPVSVYTQSGKLLGTVEKNGEKVLAPLGNQELIFACPGFADLKQTVNVLYAKETPVWLEFKPVPFKLELVVMDKFSPNGDWYEDECVIKIYSSRPATGSIQILDSSGIIVYEKSIKVGAGTTQINWDGQGKTDGLYTVKVLLSDGIVTEERVAQTALNRSVYTYKKEIVIGTIVGMILFIGYMIWSGM
ncbi:MAG: hypothetical protein ACUVQF_03455 [Fervidobacterium sp.]|uniref:hypothetical protein n=1 Tax=Fervidobacterium sp. TaxID=1871331 RepID=UPI00404B2FA0